MWIIWTIVIGFVAGVLAKFLTPGDTHEPQGFILTTLLGIAGAFVMTYLGQALGWYQEGQATGFFGANSGRSPNSVGVGLHRIQENPLIRGRSCRVHSSSSGSTSHRLNALFGVVLDAVDGAVDRVGHHRSGIVRRDFRGLARSSRTVHSRIVPWYSVPIPVPTGRPIT